MIKEEIEIFQGKDAPFEEIINVFNTDMIKLQILGTGTCNIQILCKLKKSTKFLPVAIIDESSFDILEYISKEGSYTVSTTGYDEVKLVVNDIQSSLSGVLCEVKEI